MINLLGSNVDSVIASLTTPYEPSLWDVAGGDSSARCWVACHGGKLETPLPAELGGLGRWLRVSSNKVTAAAAAVWPNVQTPRIRTTTLVSQGNERGDIGIWQNLRRVKENASSCMC
jgi:hypothetical protein